jgi:hypothetical protein
VHEIEVGSGRSALHKAAFWNHKHMMPWLLSECKINPNLMVHWIELQRERQREIGCLNRYLF